MIIETTRLRLREMDAGDLPALRAILQDPLVMVAYEGAFDDDGVDEWLQRQRDRYLADGFGLWAVESRDTGRVIGQCGLTRQSGSGEEAIEVGYLFCHDVWGKGYATEAAAGCVQLAFDTIDALPGDAVHAQIRDTNIASMNVAIRLGMTVRGRFTKRYRGITMPHLDFAVSRSAWEVRKREVGNPSESMR
ncbi:GNAT family N-acetyltransferase [Microbacterium sp. H1-D42]|uniref:GNAT family N-acetyltransferase n=1 Tax=Microbacterium sp. H1-D42 TaxID=2925844 RepID=UPI001F531FA8|nr:GNAT family N-acetyltransferase [Microbacterium sp. H1-D42]UNK69827.1 GNAT family N-acetyltransferase [Microbacterium sp. H1-D42]